MKVAFLGLGIMGQAMATNLVKGGHEVAVWNRSAGKTVEGAVVASTPREAAAGAEVVWMCVSDTAAVERVLFGADGADASLTEGMIIADSSTISPTATVDFAARVAKKGVAYVDAPMTGSKVAAAAGTLVFIVGGTEADIARLQPVFDSMGKKVFRMGETGKGQATKLAMNLQIAMIYEGFAEALTLATKMGVDRDFTPNFPLRLMHKDIRLTLEAAKQARVRLPGLETVQEVYDVAMEEGYQDQDYAATLALLEKWAGAQVKGAA